ncbi:MAG TPA: RNA polymerase sigma factor [Vicinamibacterales bacterium]|nr:RNA polymerase sigma factor [Vicinamibacterales bacterium]
MDSGSACPQPSVDLETPEVRGVIERARAGDQAAFGQLIRAYERVVLRTTLAALGRREDAEDAAQEAFLQAWRHLPAFRGEATFRTWLLTIAWRKALDRRRSRLAWWKRSAVAAVDGDPFDDVAGSAPSPERAAIARDACDRTRLAIARLSPALRDTLLLAASGEHTYEDIGVVLGIPLGTVKWRVVEARRLVRARLEVEAETEREHGPNGPAGS